MDRRIFHIATKLSRQLDQDWCIDKMAAELNLSAPHFQRLFKRETGKTPAAYLHEMRLTKAAEYLSQVDCFLQVKEIGRLVGLTDESHLTRDFSARFGETPTDYREKCAAVLQFKFCSYAK